MQIKRKADPVVTDVEVEFIPEGETEPARLLCDFRVKGPHALGEYMRRASKNPDQPGAMLEVLAGLRGPLDEDGSPLELNAANLAALLDQHEGIGAKLAEAYVKACREAFRKN